MFYQKNTGFTLIEVLVSMLIITGILLGFDAIQITALRANRAAQYFTVAVLQLQNIEARLTNLEDGVGIDQEVRSWNQQNAEVLPQGRGEITGNFPDYTVSIFWEDSEHLTQLLTVLP